MTWAHDRPEICGPKMGIMNSLIRPLRATSARTGKLQLSPGASGGVELFRRGTDRPGALKPVVLSIASASLLCAALTCFPTTNPQNPLGCVISLFANAESHPWAAPGPSLRASCASSRRAPIGQERSSARLLRFFVVLLLWPLITTTFR